MQSDMYNRAKEEYDSCIEKATNWDDFMAALGRKHMVLAPWSAFLLLCIFIHGYNQGLQAFKCDFPQFLNWYGILVLRCRTENTSSLKENWSDGAGVSYALAQAQVARLPGQRFNKVK